MRYAIYSDIHSNLEAYESVLRAVKREAADRTILAGDIVGYGADPSRCLSLAKKHADVVICGN
ncbi:MAG: metallophosphoesterase, partial [Candidatus Omnitrophica bacterium]|nr:metallophosphoesterase [Candidatus Omnitrophota bacterium]